MDISQLAYQGYLEKTGLTIPEAEDVALKTNSFYKSYLELMAEFKPLIGAKNSKHEAACSLILGSIGDQGREDNLLFMKAAISVMAYHFGEESDFDMQLTNFLDDDHRKKYCSFIKQDSKVLEELKEQFIKSKTLGSRKGVWSKIFG